MAQRASQTVVPIEGIDLDTSKALVSTRKATYLKNVINAYNHGINNAGQNHNDQLLTPVLSNIDNAVFLDELFGGEITVGAKYERKLNQFFWFVWNIDRFSSIWVYDANTNIAQRVLLNVPTGTGIWSFDPHYPIASIDVVLADVSGGGQNQQILQRLLYWTDGRSEPRKINVDKAIAGGYAIVVGANDWLRRADQFMMAIKMPPYDINITNSLANPDPTYLLNFVYNKQFQFRYRYYYDDGEHSTWSPISTLAYSIIPEKNFIEITMFAGSVLVRYVELSYRLGNIGDWKSYDKILYTDIIANVTYPYTSGTNKFIYKFFGNKAYTLLDQADTNRLFDVVPLKAYSQKFVEENVILYGNILEGYDNIDPAILDAIDIEITYSDYAALTLTIDASIVFAFTAGTGFTVRVRRTDFVTGVTTTESTVTATNGVTASPLVIHTVITDINFGDRVFLEVVPNGAFTFGLRSMTGVYSNIAEPLSCGTGDFSVSDINVQTPLVTQHIIFSNEVSDLCNDWSTVTNEHTTPNYAGGFRQLKQGGRYKWGLILYDAALRSTFVQPFANEVNIEPLQENSKFQIHQITMAWNNVVFPDWVFFVKVCRTKNLNIDRSLGMGYLQFGINFNNGTDPTVGFVDFDGTVTAAPTATTQKVRFKLTALITFNTLYYENTTTTYTWTQGDRIQFIRNGNGTWFDFATFGLIDKELSTDPAAPDVAFIADYDPSLATLADGAWVELYTPAKEEATDIYYEISDLIPTWQVQTKNVLVPATTLLDTFDTYPVYWPTPFLSNVTDGGVTPFEHHSIYREGTVPSNGEDIGRINVVNVDARQLWYPARIRWSNAYLPNSFYNGLSTFKDENKKDYFRQYGGIRILHASGTNLLILQEDNCFRAILNKKLVTLADGGTQLTATDTFLSDPIEINGSFGCQNPESFVPYNELMLWVDTKRAAIIECNWSQAIDIARTGMIKSYAEAKLKYIANYNQQESATETCGFGDLSGFLPILITSSITVVYDGTFTNYPVAVQINTIVELATFLTATGLDTFFAIGNYLYVATPTHNYGQEFFGGGNGISGYESNNGASILIWTIASTISPVAGALITCNNNFFLLPAGFNPKHNTYVLTFWKCVTAFGSVGNSSTVLPYYTWFIGDDFPTGDAIDITITVDTVDYTDTFAIETIQDILDAVNSLLPAGANGLTDTFTLIDNDTTLHVIASSLQIYGNNLIIDSIIFLANYTSNFEYVNLEYDISMDRSETLIYNIEKNFWNGFMAYTGEHYCYNDGHLFGLSQISFREATPYFHDLSSVTTYNKFFTIQSDQIIKIVSNLSPETEKRWQAIAVNSKNKTSSITAVAYEGYLVTTSDNQSSVIPIAGFKFKENILYSVFFRSTDLNGTLQNGAMLRGTYIEVTLVRDTTEAVRQSYSEFQSATIFFFTSEKAIK